MNKKKEKTLKSKPSEIKHSKGCIHMQEKKSYYCCSGLGIMLELSDSPIIYLPPTRSYVLRLNDDTIFTLKYCPCCGTAFPQDLTDELTHIIYKELAFDDYNDPKVPAQFRSDEWWKNRKEYANDCSIVPKKANE